MRMGRLSSTHLHEHACMPSNVSWRQPPSSAAPLVTLRARHRTVRTGTRRDDNVLETARTDAHGMDCWCRYAPTARRVLRAVGFFDSSQTTWQAPFEERRVGRHGLKLRTNPGVSKHHLPRNNARYALQTARHRRCRWPISLDETRVCHLVVLWLSSSF